MYVNEKFLYNPLYNPHSIIVRYVPEKNPVPLLPSVLISTKNA